MDPINNQGTESPNKKSGSSRILSVTLAQATPQLIESSLSVFDREIKEILGDFPQTELLVFPELHLFGDGTPDLAREEALRASADPLDGERGEVLKQLAKDNQIWLVPGTVCEAGDNGEIFKIQIVLSPNGELVGSYRKVFPWRPAELYDPGNKFDVVHTGELNLGLSICHDAWFPESTRRLAWSGAEVILNVVKTTTPDRQQVLILAQANAIVYQVLLSASTWPGRLEWDAA